VKPPALPSPAASRPDPAHVRPEHAGLAPAKAEPPPEAHPRPSPPPPAAAKTHAAKAPAPPPKAKPKAPPKQHAPKEKPHGYLSISAHTATLVYLDGKKLGTTPLTRLRLAPGKHDLLLRRGEQRLRRTILIRAQHHLKIGVG
jgi:hypothetical protein